MEKNVKNILSELINIPSYGEIGANHPIIKYLEDAFSSCKEIVKLQDEMGNNHLLVGVNTNLQNLSNAFLFSGHIDTVPQHNGHLPFCQEIDGYLTGLGSADMKGFVSTLIANIENFKKINKPIVFSLTSDEETDFYGIETIIAEMLKRNITPEEVIVGEPTSSFAASSHRGNAIFISKVEGKACHSSTPELGINAINLSMEAISEIEECIKRYNNNASICITKIEGGKACNIVPDLCTTTISVRTSSKHCLQSIATDLKKIYDQLNKRAIKSSIENVFNIPAFENIRNSKLKALFSGDNDFNFTGATEAGFIQEAFSEADILIYGPGNPTCIHQCGEKIDSNELLHYSQTLPIIVSKFSNMQKERDNNHDLQL